MNTRASGAVVDRALTIAEHERAELYEVVRRFYQENRDLSADGLYSVFANALLEEKTTGRRYTFGLRSTAHMVVKACGLQKIVYDRQLHRGTNAAYMDLGEVYVDDLQGRLRKFGFSLLDHPQLKTQDRAQTWEDEDWGEDEDWAEAECTDSGCTGWCDDRSHNWACNACLTGNCAYCRKYRRFYGKPESVHRAHRRLA